MIHISWEKKKILILVKAYPEKSDKLGSAICTAGITEENEWIRIYPIGFDYFVRKLNFKKFTWIEAEVQKANEKLMRKESYKVRQKSIKIIDDSLSNIKVNEEIKRKIWSERQKIINSMVNNSVQELRNAYKKDKTSLGLIKPELIDFRFRKPFREINIDVPKTHQKSIDNSRVLIADRIEHIISYKFKCQGIECNCKKETRPYHDMTCEDWELFAALRKWPYENEIMEEKIREKFYKWMKEKRDLYFCMGMISRYPQWVIIGLLYPPRN